MKEEELKSILQEYAFGTSGTRDTINKIGGRDFADLMIALAKYDLPIPKSDPTGREQHIYNANQILVPLFQNHV